MARTSRFRTPAALAVAALLAASPAFAATPDNYIGGDVGLWSDPTNWSAGEPNSNAFDVTVDNASAINVQFDTSVTIDTLSLSAPDMLTILGRQTLTLAGNSLVNTGTINFAGTSSSLAFTSNATLSGAGVLLLNSTSSSIGGAVGTYLTTDNLISGFGNLGQSQLKLINTGTITATANTLTLAPANATDGFTNAGTLRANGGTLLLGASTYANASGTIEAWANSLVTFSTSATVNGGTMHALAGGSLAASGTFNDVTFQADSGGVLTFSHASLNGVTINGNSSVSNTTLYNSLSNNGVLSLDTATSGTLPTSLSLNGTGTLILGGGGSITYGSQPLNVLSIREAVQSAGLASIDVNFVNSGTISAVGGTLTLASGNSRINFGVVATSFTNNGFIAAQGGTLIMGEGGGNVGFIFDNTQGVVEADAGSTVLVKPVGTGTLTGGMWLARDGGTLSLDGIFSNAVFNSSNGGQVVVATGQLASLLSSTNNTLITVSGIAGLNGTNRGTISLSGAATFGLGALINGGGLVLMNSSSDAIGGGVGVLETQTVTDNHIIGRGSFGNGLNLRLDNAGTITALGGVLTINVAEVGTFDELTNAGLLSADTGGTLVLAGGNCPNTGGTIEAVHGGVVIVRVPITGGVLQADSSSSLVIAPRIVNPGIFQNFTNQNTLIFSDDNTLPGIPVSPQTLFTPMLSGTISNLGTIMLAHSAGATTDLKIISDTSLTGHGTVTLSTVGAATARFADTLTSNSPAFLLATADFMLTTDNLIEGAGSLCDSHTNINNLGEIIANALPGLTIVASGTRGFTSTGLLRADGAPLTFINASTLGSFTISGTMEAINGGSLILSATNGQVTDSSPIMLANGHLVVSSAASLANVTGTGDVSVSAPGASPSISDGITTTSLTIGSGATHTLRQNNATTGTSKLASSLAIANNAGTFTGKLDLTNNALILQTDPATPNDKSNKLAFLSSALLSGFDNGDWLGNGITSATVAADNAATGSHTTTLALYDNAALNLPTIGGLSADSNSLFITTALIADANFDGILDKTDFDIWYAHAMTYAFSDSDGDFNHDGVVDGRDFALWFAHAPNAQAIVDSEGLDPDTLAALFLPPLTVPEPASILFLAPLAALLRRRRRGSRRA